METNRKLANIKENAIRKFDAQVSEIPGLIKFTLGAPDFNMPDFVKEAAIQAIEDNQSHYAPTQGYLSTRQAIADFMNRHHQLTYSPEEEIIVTVGVTEALNAVFQGILSDGDQVLVPIPFFSLYDNVIMQAGGESVHVSTEETGFVLTPETLRDYLDRYPKTKAVLLNYPQNPTGITYTREELAALAEVCREYEIFVVADEIYAELVYDGIDHVSMAHLYPEGTIIVHGVSKNLAMTGHRIGWICVPKEYYLPIFISHQVMVTCPNSVSMLAAEAGLRDGDGEIEHMRQTYEERRNFIVPELEKLGFEIARPQGAFYLFIKIPEKFEQDDFEFALELAREAKVGVVPGSAFGEAGRGYLRFSYASSTENLVEGARRLNDYLANK